MDTRRPPLPRFGVCVCVFASFAKYARTLCALAFTYKLFVLPIRVCCCCCFVWAAVDPHTHANKQRHDNMTAVVCGSPLSKWRLPPRIFHEIYIIHYEEAAAIILCVCAANFLTNNHHVVMCFLFTAIRLAKTAQHRAVDAVLPDVQETALSVGAARWPSGQLQGGSRSGHSAEEDVPQGGAVLSCEFF